MISISNNILIPERLIKSMPVVAVGGVLCMGVVRGGRCVCGGGGVGGWVGGWMCRAEVSQGLFLQ